MDFDKFDDYLNKAKEYDKKCRDIYLATDWSIDLFNLFSSINNKYNLNLSDNIISILEDVFNDEEGWINYWAYELDYGTRAEEFEIKLEDKKYILKTTKDLYDFLKIVYQNN